jgi:hypothetical protein
VFTRFREFVSPEFWRGDRGWYGSVGASTLFHAGLLAVFGLFWFSVATPTRTPLDSRWSPPERLRDMASIDPIVQPDATQTQEAGGRSPEDALSQGDASESVTVSGVQAVAAVSPLALSAWIPENLNEEVGELAHGGLGEGSGNETGDGTGGGFFGTGINGRRIAFVVDCSGSMNHPHSSEAKTRFRLLKYELIQAITAMDSGMEFFVIFFNHEAHPMPASTMVPATPENQKRYLEWVARFRPGGNTDPRVALQMAMRLGPDVIYLLTDGEFKRRIERDLLRLQQTSVAIHTICLGDRGGEKILKAIAESNNGVYRFVP